MVEMYSAVCWMGRGVNILWYIILTHPHPPPPFKVKFEDKLETVELLSRLRIVILNHD